MARARIKVLSIAALTLIGIVGCQPQKNDSSLRRMLPIEKLDLERRSLDLLVRAAKSEYEDVRAHALEALVDVAPRQGLPYFRKALRSKHPLVRHVGLISLGKLRDRTSLREYSRLVNDEHPLVRLSAAFAALRSGGDDQVYGPVLGDALRRGKDEAVRSEAAYLLGLWGDKRAIPRLKEAVANDESARVIVLATGALAMLGDELSLDSLIYLTQGETVTRIMALQCLVEIADKRAEEAFHNRLYQSDADQEYIVLRLMAARGLGKIGIDDGFKGALYAAKNSDYISKRNSGDSAALEKKLGEAVTEAHRLEERRGIAVNAALALGAIGNELALPTLAEMAEADEPRVQVAACAAILQIIQKND